MIASHILTWRCIVLFIFQFYWDILDRTLLFKLYSIMIWHTYSEKIRKYFSLDEFRKFFKMPFNHPFIHCFLLCFTKSWGFRGIWLHCSSRWYLIHFLIHWEWSETFEAWVVWRQDSNRVSPAPFREIFTYRLQDSDSDSRNDSSSGWREFLFCFG